MHTESSKSAGEHKPQQEHKHPDEWQDDLSRNHMAGQNVGPHSEERERDIPTAYDLKDMPRVLKDFTDDDLKQIPVLPTGSRLQQGATYVDLADSARQEFRVNAGVTAEPGHYWVPKSRVPYPLWNRLIGEEKPGQ